MSFFCGPPVLSVFRESQTEDSDTSDPHNFTAADKDGSGVICKPELALMMSLRQTWRLMWINGQHIKGNNPGLKGLLATV
jgi:hypothetical protein